MHQTCRLLLAVLLTMTSTWSTLAAATTRPHDASVTAGQRAGDDALQRLIDEVMSLRAASGQTLSMLLARAPDGERALRQAVIAQHQESRVRRLADGRVEVDAWLPVAGLAPSLQQIAAQYLPQSDRKHLAPAPGVGPVVVATGRYRDDGRLRADRPGWRHCDARHVALAEAASEVDLHANLFDRIAHLPLPGPQTVGDLMGNHLRFREAVHRRINRMAAGEPVLEPTGLCRRTVAITRAEALTLLAQAAAESAERIRADFSRLADPDLEAPLTVNGFGVAPPPLRADENVLWATDAARPGWADEFLTARATGKGPADAGDDQTRRELAARAARIEATRQLWMEIESLPLPGGGTIGALLANDPKAVEAFAAIDDAILPTGAPVFGTDGTASVSVGIPLKTVWRIGSPFCRSSR